MTGHRPIPPPSQTAFWKAFDGVFTVDESWKVTSFNRAAEEITGIPREEALGKRCWEVFRASMCEMDCALKHTMDTGKRVINRSCYIIDAGGQRIPISVSTALLRDVEGQVIGGAETFRDLSLVEDLRKEITGRFQIGDMVSRSALMRRLFDVLPQIAASDSSVLIQGETGTGKELLARAVHSMIGEPKAPLSLSTAALCPTPSWKVSSSATRRGLLPARTKTSPAVLPQRRVAPCSWTKSATSRRHSRCGCCVYCRNTYTTHWAPTRRYGPTCGSSLPGIRTLPNWWKREARRDLYYRINVVRLELPPLRKRKEDVPLLVEHFIARFNRVQNRDIQGVTSATMAVLMAHDYPGNIRELENIIEHAFVLCAVNKDIDIPCLPDYLARRAHPDTGPVPIVDARKSLEAQLILETLERNHGNRQAAARELGMHKSTLFRKMRALHLPYAHPSDPPNKSQ